MSLKISKIVAVCLLSCSLLVSSCGGDFNIFAAHKAEMKNIQLEQPVTLLMPSTNYNERPKDTKIDTIIIHHTAPFSSLARVGYYFQDVNSRVSSHYIVGKEGLIIESVAEKDRAWHAGPSSWRGKYNVNDYSVGIEVLNDGDNKDPFTEPQYNSLAKLVAYLMKKYDIPLSRVIGHRDIAFPLGRKVDPADNFDWKLFKTKIRTILKQRAGFFGPGDLPQQANFSLVQIQDFLYSNSTTERCLAVDGMLTVDYKPMRQKLTEIFNKEPNPLVQVKFLRLFENYDDKSLLDAARRIFENYQIEPVLLTAAAATYLYMADKDKSQDLFFNTFMATGLSSDLRYALIRVLSNYKDEKITKVLLDDLAATTDLQEKKILIENLAKSENKALNKVLLPYLDDNMPYDIRAATIETLRITFDENVENRLSEIIKSGNLGKIALEAAAWTLLRKDSKKGIALLQEENIFKKLSPKVQTGLVNTIGKLKLAGTEEWLIRQTDLTGDNYLKGAAYLALGSIPGDKSFNYLFKSLKDNLSSNLVLFKSLSGFDRPEMSRALAQVMQKENVPAEVKLLAISTIKEKKLVQLLPLLKALYAENREPDIDLVIEDTIRMFEPKEKREEESNNKK